MNLFKKLTITVIDIFIWIVLSTVLVDALGVLYLSEEFYHNYNGVMRLIFYFLYFIISDFIFKKTITMLLFNSKLNIPKQTNIFNILTYELIGLIDVLLISIHFIRSLYFGSRKGKKLLKEKYTEIEIVKK